MAEFLNRIKIKVEKVATKTTKKANKVIDKTKLNLNLKMEESNLSECFEELGKAFFLQVKSNAANDDKIAELIEKADKIESKIDALKEEIAKGTERKKCPNCGKALKSEKYCPNCGAKVEADKTPADTVKTEEPKASEDEVVSCDDIASV
jgi:ribosomal protein L32